MATERIALWSQGNHAFIYDALAGHFNRPRSELVFSTENVRRHGVDGVLITCIDNRALAPVYPAANQPHEPDAA